MRVTCDDCVFERVNVDRELTVWRVHVPVDARPFRVITNKLEEIAPGNDAQLVFSSDRLKSLLAL